MTWKCLQGHRNPLQTFVAYMIQMWTTDDTCPPFNICPLNLMRPRPLQFDLLCCEIQHMMRNTDMHGQSTAERGNRGRSEQDCSDNYKRAVGGC